jgi:protein TonB
MKQFALFLFVFISATHTHAQQVPPPPPPFMSDTTGDDETDSLDFDKEFKTVQIEAKFPGGNQAWIQFLQKNMKPNTPVKNKAPRGAYVVVVSFLVDKTGKVYEVNILKDPGYGCAEDVLRVFKKCPNWIPAEQNGKKVIYRQKQTVSYLVE